MRLRSASKGHSWRRGCACCSAVTSSPASCAACSSAVSVGSPRQPPAPGMLSAAAASLHSTAAVHSCSSGTPKAQCSRLCMRLSVSVPVLSAQITLTEPSVSTLGRRRTSACTAASRRAPSASSTVTTAGRASGMAATARLRAVSAIISSGSPRSSPSAKTSAQMTSTASDSRRPKAASRRCSGVARNASAPSSAATRPSSVRAPVATTRPAARPCVTSVPLNAMFERSPSGRSPAGSAACIFSTVTDSPVRADSSTRSRATSCRRRSAGTRLPASSSTTSPGTRCSVCTTCTWPPARRTVACGAAIRCSACRARSARRSCQKPMAALSSTMIRMTAVSARSPTSPDNAAAASRTRIMKSRNWSSSRCQPGRGAACGSRFGPCASWRCSTSSAGRPAWGSTPKWRASSALPCAWACAGSELCRPVVGMGHGARLAADLPQPWAGCR